MDNETPCCTAMFLAGIILGSVSGIIMYSVHTGTY